MNQNKFQTAEVTAVAENILQECIGARLRTLNRVVTRIYDDHLRSSGIRFSQLNVLMLIIGRGPLTAKEIGTMLSLEKSTLSRNLRIMEDSGWVVRKPLASSGRIALEATDKGRGKVLEAEVHWRSAQQSVIKLLGTAESSSIKTAFESVQVAAGP